ncbi:DUF1435 domain-containing protein [Enterobacteriaceae bacterium BIT-l23]|uniref:DUF1435 domain-containing protein n=1 Tax=Jejubacter calystegiae TaxID=2579935 RepID=A0A4P8YID9_9ENTR|nr:DUF1435 family protein [Jejubacter calystegiae]NUU66234.1 DUF1435 domain-containing protein [Enterobacteriaceae bacterium BIT-l23]QCT19773.1 DUF1435 domain-containing protein [Jejubacter calystegiae]
MLQRGLESGWAGLFSGVLVASGLILGDLSFGTWRLLMALAMVATVAMLFHRRLRHYLLLPSCIVVAMGMVPVLMHSAAFSGH